MSERVIIFKRFERFWHWSQAALIIVLLMTGFEIHGTYQLFGFEKAVMLHTHAALTLVTLLAFTIFWHFTTGEWRQYIPTLKKVDAMIKYYLLGIFINAPHPFRTTVVRKHNPLQRLAYLFMWVVISPMIWLSGLTYLFYANWHDWGLDQYLVLEDIALLHVVSAFMMLLFLIVHIYLITTGDTVTSHLKAMITGWDEIDEDAEES